MLAKPSMLSASNLGGDVLGFNRATLLLSKIRRSTGLNPSMAIRRRVPFICGNLLMVKWPYRFTRGLDSGKRLTIDVTCPASACRYDAGPDSIYLRAAWILALKAFDTVSRAVLDNQRADGHSRVKVLYYVPTLTRYIMKSVNVRELKNNPSEALRMARDDMVVVMNRDEPQALLVHLHDDGLLTEEGVRAAMAISLYRDGSLALGRAARLAGMAPALFMQLLSQRGLPIIKGDSATLREDIETLDAWLAQ